MKKKGKKGFTEKNIGCYDLYDEMSLERTKKRVKWVQSKCPWDSSINIIDLSLSGKGMDEDKMYALQADLRNKIRRGNSLIEVNGEDGY